MRLIDSDVLEKDIRKRMGGLQAEREIFESINDLQPTAYDVDKVCRRISENKEMDNLIDADLVIKIIKSGGID